MAEAGGSTVPPRKKGLPAGDKLPTSKVPTPAEAEAEAKWIAEKTRYTVGLSYADVETPLPGTEEQYRAIKEEVRKAEEDAAKEYDKPLPKPGTAEHRKAVDEGWPELEKELSAYYDDAKRKLLPGEELVETREQFLARAKKEAYATPLTRSESKEEFIKKAKRGVALTYKPDIKTLAATRTLGRYESTDPKTGEKGTDIIKAGEELGWTRTERLLRDIGMSKAEAEATVNEARDFAKDHHRTDFGEYIPKTEWKELNKGQQLLINKYGTKKYFEAFNKRHVELGDGTYIQKGTWKKLTPKEQELAKTEGFKSISYEGLKGQALFDKMQKLGRIEPDKVYAGTNDKGEILVREMLRSESESKAVQEAIAKMGKDKPDKFKVTFKTADGRSFTNVYAFKRDKLGWAGKQVARRVDAGDDRVYTTNVNPEAVKTPKEEAISMAEFFVPGVYQARHWNEMENWQKGLYCVLDAAFVGGMARGPAVAALKRTVKPAANAARRMMGATGTKVLTRELGNLEKAIRSGKVSNIQKAGARLEALGQNMEAKNLPGAKMIRQHGLMARLEAKQIATGHIPVLSPTRGHLRKRVQSIMKYGDEGGGREYRPQRQPAKQAERGKPLQQTRPETSRQARLADRYGISERQIEQIWQQSNRDPRRFDQLFNKEVQGRRATWDLINKINERTANDILRQGQKKVTTVPVTQHRHVSVPQPTRQAQHFTVSRQVALKQARIKQIEEHIRKLKKQPGTTDLVKTAQKALAQQRKELQDLMRQAAKGKTRTPSVEVLRRIHSIRKHHIPTWDTSKTKLRQGMAAPELRDLLAFRTVETLDKLRKLQGAVRKRLLGKLDPKTRALVKKALKAKTNTKALAVSTMKLKEHLQPTTEAMTKAKVEAAAKATVKPDFTTKPALKPKTETRAEAAPTVKPRVEPKLEPKAEAAPEPRRATAPKPVTPTKPKPTPEVKTATDVRVPDLARGFKLHKRLRLPSTKAGDKQPSTTDMVGLHSWRQGFCWITLLPDGNKLFTRKPPPGAKVVKGSPQKTLYVRGGKIPKVTRRTSVGFMKVQVAGKDIDFNARSNGRLKKRRRGRLLK